MTRLVPVAVQHTLADVYRAHHNVEKTVGHPKDSSSMATPDTVIPSHTIPIPAILRKVALIRAVIAGASCNRKQAAQQFESHLFHPNVAPSSFAGEKAATQVVDSGRRALP
eukprot:Skav223414  [mRNA]  locus=scaffold350:231956:232288:+ [translate_table: standard]